MGVNAVSHQVWKFQRYVIVMEYEQKPSLPPPLIIFSHLYLIYKYCIKTRFTSKKDKDWYSDYGLSKLFANFKRKLFALSDFHNLHFEHAAVGNLRIL